MKPVHENKEDYLFFDSYQTRRRANDVSGHMNNTVVYEFADSLVNHWLNISGALTVPNDSVVGLVVHTQCDYFSQIGHPDLVTCGLKVSNIGNTSVSYDVGLFRSDQFYCAAQISFVHVYVSASNRIPVSLPKSLIKAMKTIS